MVSRARPAGARLLERLPSTPSSWTTGFRTPRLTKDFSLIVIDAAAGLGSGRVFPLGSDRASLRPAGMADAIFFLGERRNAPV